MSKKLSKRQKKLIDEHNTQMKIVSDTAKVNGLSQSLLYYAAHFGIIGIPWIVRN